MIDSRQYPVFSPNQVLSAGQMNDILGYLEPQDRATRTLCIGRGILCGLAVRSAADRITLEPGAGLTSDGLIVPVREERVFHFTADFDDTRSKYGPFWNAGETDQIPLLELLEAEPDDDDIEATPVADLDLGDYAVLLYVAEHLVDLTACLANDCDNQGFERNFDLHALLIKKSDLLAILREGDPRLAEAETEDQVTSRLNCRYDLAPRRLARPPLRENGVGDYRDITGAYRRLCSDAISDVSKQLQKAYACYGKLVGDYDINGVVRQLSRHLASLDEGRGLQYLYDFLDDLYHAYNEFLETAFGFSDLCGIETGRFSRHLMLGPAVAGDDCRPTIYRHFFTPALETFRHGDSLEGVRVLFRRVVEIVRQFRFDRTLTDIRITPEMRGGPLEKRALPYYYRYDGLKPYWSPSGRRRCAFDPPSYFRSDDDLLQLSLEDKNHFRIEGHMYQGKEKAVDALERLRARHNLPFHIESLELGELDEGESAGGCSLPDLRLLYEITRLDALCFIEDKIRFLTNIVQADFQPETEEEKQEDKEYTFTPTPLESALKLNYREVLDFSRNRVFQTQARIGAKKGQEPAAVDQPQPRAAVSAELAFTDATMKPLMGVVDYTPYTGLKESKYEGLIDEEEIKKTAVPQGVESIVKRKPSVTAKTGAAAFEKEIRPSKTGRRETPLKEDSTALVVEAADIALAFPKTSVTEYPKLPKPVLGDRLLQELIGRLTKLLEQIPEDVHDYDLEVTRDAYEVIKDKALALNDIVADLLGNPEYEVKGIEYGLIAECMEIADSCIDERLTHIVERHNREWQAAENAGLFSEFVKQHPGVDHRAGVPKGGTFILVSGVVKAEKRRRLVDRLTLPRLYKQPPLAVYQQRRGNVYENMLRTAGHFNKKAFTWSKRIDLNRVTAKPTLEADIPAVSLEKNRSALLDSLLRRIRTDEEEVVVFDFCLPYVKPPCTEIKYVVLAELKLYLPKEAFCIGDKESYAFGVYPPGGVVSGPGVKKVKETYYFTPADSSVGEQTFSYTIGGKEIQLVARVHPQPKARFDVTVDRIEAGSAVVEFENLSEEAEAFQWDFGDGKSSGDHSPTHIYDLSEETTFTVTLTAEAGPCADTAEETLNLTPVEFSIEGGVTEFCEDDESTYPLTLSPEGGDLSGEGISEEAFVPGQVLLDNAADKEVVLTYAVEGQTAEIRVRVFAVPEPAFSAELIRHTDTAALFRFTNETTNGASYRWDFGDGQTSTQESPEHAYETGGEASTFTVTLTAENGPCGASISRTVSIEPVTFRLLAETTDFCGDDETAYGFETIPEGGVISGPGIVDGQFRPADVDLAGRRSNTVTISYKLADARGASLRLTVHNPPALSFSTAMTPVENGISVTFDNTSTFADRFVWNFGDGTDKVEEFAPKHLYLEEGVYDVVLTGTNEACEASLTQSVSVKAGDTPVLGVPLEPIRSAIDLLGTAQQEVLSKFETEPGPLTDFQKRLLEAVRTENAGELAMDDPRLTDQVGRYGTLAEMMLQQLAEHDETIRHYIISVYRLGVANLINLLSRRKEDLTEGELLKRLQNLAELTGALDEQFKISQISVTGYQLLPGALYETMPNLMDLHKVFSERL